MVFFPLANKKDGNKKKMGGRKVQKEKEMSEGLFVNATQ